jgi:hypothetical protein
MIALNRPRPFIFIGWEDLPCKQRFTTRNQAKFLILPEFGETRLNHPWGRLDHLAPMCRTSYSTHRSYRPGDPVWPDCLTWVGFCQIWVSTICFFFYYQLKINQRCQFFSFIWLGLGGFTLCILADWIPTLINRRWYYYNVNFCLCYTIRTRRLSPLHSCWLKSARSSLSMK